MSDPGEELARSWRANAAGWTEAVRSGTIASRRLGTDAAIVDAVLTRAPERVLDLGCGEGWLTRAMAARGVAVVGVDGSEELIDIARGSGTESYLRLSYSDIVTGPARLGGPFDAIVANFALLEEDLVPLLTNLRLVLSPDGALLIQTVHPWTARADGPYRDGWRTEHFRDFGEGFTAPMPWYYRTLESWSALLSRSGFHIERIRESLHPEASDPLSLLIEAIPSHHP